MSKKTTNKSVKSAKCANYTMLTRPTLTEETNLLIEEIVSSVIREAVNHFMTSRPRSYSDDSRFFYQKSELDTFWRLFKGDPSTLKCDTILDERGGVFCYEIYRVKENRS